MNRRNFLNNSSLVFGSLLLPLKSFESLFPNYSDYKIRTVRGDVKIFTEKGGTIAWMAQPGGVVVVDTQFPEQAGHLLKEIKKLSVREMDLLINTHHHRDHTAGNIAFKGLTNQIVAHRNSKKNQKISAQNNGSEDQQLYPKIVFDESWSTRVGFETITATYFGAAHTDGDAVIHFANDNVAHIGDLVFNRRYPYIDRPAGANIQNWIEVLEQIQKKYDNDTIFVFGHAREPYDVIGNKEDLKAMQNYLESLLTFMRKEIKSGKSKLEIYQATSIPGADEWQGKGIERSLKSAYEELTAE